MYVVGTAGIFATVLHDAVMNPADGRFTLVHFNSLFDVVCNIPTILNIKCREKTRGEGREGLKKEETLGNGLCIVVFQIENRYSNPNEKSKEIKQNLKFILFPRESQTGERDNFR